MEVKEVAELVGPVGGMFDIPTCIVGGKGGSAERPIGVALCGEVGSDGTPSHMEFGGVHCHGGAWVKVWVD